MTDSPNFGWWLPWNFFFFLMFFLFLLCIKPLSNFIYFRARIHRLILSRIAWYISIILLVPKIKCSLFQFHDYPTKIDCSISQFHDYPTEIKQFFMSKRSMVPVGIWQRLFNVCA